MFAKRERKIPRKFNEVDHSPFSNLHTIAILVIALRSGLVTVVHRSPCLRLRLLALILPLLFRLVGGPRHAFLSDDY